MTSESSGPAPWAVAVQSPVEPVEELSMPDAAVSAAPTGSSAPAVQPDEATLPAPVLADTSADAAEQPSAAEPVLEPTAEVPGSGTAVEPATGVPAGNEVAPQTVGRRVAAHPPLDDVLRIGDPGRQAEIVPVHGPLCVGVSDTELDFFTAEPFEVRACSTRGASHRHAGVPRQDAYCLATNDDWVALCVADGVSQGRHSQVAAETASRAACKLVLEAAGGEQDWTALANRVSRRIVEEARYRRLVDVGAIEDLAEQVRAVRQILSTTLVVALVARTAAASGAYPCTLVVLAGDSGAYLLREQAFSVLAGGKDLDPNRVADSSVHPLPGPTRPTVLEMELEPGQALLLTSDGVGDALGDGTGDVGSVLAGRWTAPPTAAQLLVDVNFLRRSYDDDRTVVGLWPLHV